MKKTQQLLVTIISIVITLTFFVSTAQAQVWGGDYTIWDNDDVAVLSGYTEVTGNLTIGDIRNWSSPLLTSLIGLENLTRVGGTLWITPNTSLLNLNGLENLTSIGEDLIIDRIEPIGRTELRNLNGLEGLTSIGGSLIINDSEGIESLSGLENLTSVGGGLRIYGGFNNLTNLNGLEGLTSLGGDLYIGHWYSGTNIPSLVGLDNITSIGGSLIIEDAYALTNLNGLEGLTSVGGDLDIWYNNALTSLSGLGNLTSVGGDLWIEENYALTSINALSNITGSVGGDLWIENNYALTSLSGLDNVTSVGGDLYIEYNDVLTSLSGLDNITSVGGWLRIENNDVLTNLCALYNVNLSGSSLEIYGNSVLSMDTAYALETLLRINGFTGTADIHDNNGTVAVFCDNDNDNVYDHTDNCPNVSNLDQEDADGDGIGDVCDSDTIYGYVTGGVQGDVNVSLYRPSCGIATLLDTTMTSSTGYYAFGNLNNGNYMIVPYHFSYSFVPESDTVLIPQDEIHSYDFTTIVSCGQ